MEEARRLPIFKSMKLVAISLVLMIGGSEIFLAFSESLGATRWVPLLVACGGIVVIGLGLPVNRNLPNGVSARLVVVFIYGFYVTLSAFFRYRGLSKGIEPNSLNLLGYFARVTLAVGLAVGIASIPRFLNASKTDL